MSIDSCDGLSFSG